MLRTRTTTSRTNNPSPQHYNTNDNRPDDDICSYSNTIVDESLRRHACSPGRSLDGVLVQPRGAGDQNTEACHSAYEVQPHVLAAVVRPVQRRWG